MLKRLIIAICLALSPALWAIPATENQPVRFEKGRFSEPEVVHKVNPKYPEEARKEDVKGVVVLETVIDIKGTVSDVKIVEDPDARLSAAAVEAVRQWKFKPAKTNQGEEVAVIYSVTIKFSLQ